MQDSPVSSCLARKYIAKILSTSKFFSKLLAGQLYTFSQFHAVNKVSHKRGSHFLSSSVFLFNGEVKRIFIMHDFHRRYPLKVSNYLCITLVKPPCLEDPYVDLLKFQACWNEDCKS